MHAHRSQMEACQCEKAYTLQLIYWALNTQKICPKHERDFSSCPSQAVYALSRRVRAVARLICVGPCFPSQRRNRGKLGPNAKAKQKDGAGRFKEVGMFPVKHCSSVPLALNSGSTTQDDDSPFILAAIGGPSSAASMPRFSTPPQHRLVFS